MKEIVKEICKWSDDVGISSLRLSNELLILQGEIFELSKALHDYYTVYDKKDLLENVKEEIGDVFISLINCKYIEYGRVEQVVSYVSTIKFFKKITRHYTDVQARLSRLFASVSERYAQNMDVSIAYSQEIIYELDAIAKMLNLELVGCVKFALNKNVSRNGRVIDGIVVWEHK